MFDGKGMRVQVAREIITTLQLTSYVTVTPNEPIAGHSCLAHLQNSMAEWLMEDKPFSLL